MESVITFLYASIGFFGALSVVLFTWGFGVYLARLGLEIREEGLLRMNLAVNIALFVTILITILRWLES